MFPKNCYTVSFDPAQAVKITGEKLDAHAFAPTTSTEVLSQGWGSVRDGELVYSYMGYLQLSFVVEKKTVPGSAIKIRTAELAAAREDEVGHAPGRKHLKELKNRATDELMARAIPSRKAHMVWVNTKTGRLMVNTTSNALVTTILAYLYQCTEIQCSGVSMPGTEQMTSWLADAEDSELPGLLTVDDFVVFEHPGEKGKTVRYDHANMSDTDVLENVSNGATALTLALTYDSQISFKLKDGVLSGITPLGILAEKRPSSEDAFQNDFYLMAESMGQLIKYLEAQA